MVFAGVYTLDIAKDKKEENSFLFFCVNAEQKQDKANVCDIMQ